MIIMKFGGTSVQDAPAIKKVAEIVESKKDKSPIVVVSAMSKVTDTLIKIGCLAKEHELNDAKALIAGIRERHLKTLHELTANGKTGVPDAYNVDAIEKKLLGMFSELEMLATSVATLGELTLRTHDAIVSFGERLSSLIITAGFQARGTDSQWVDARKFIITDDHFTSAVPIMKELEPRTCEELLPILESGAIPITQGFIGSTLDGITTTIGRGGSDYSAALIGAAIGAQAIEIWTDVDGMMTTDPRVVADAKRIRVISFAEAAELSYFGAKVLHPSTVLPAVERKIPVHIFNTKNPSCEGTRIVADKQPSTNLIKAIAFKRNVTIVNINSTRMLMAYGFMRHIFEVFEKYKTSVDVVATSEVSISVTVDNIEHLESIKDELSGIGEVTVETAKAIVCVVGDNLKYTSGMAARLFQAVSSINVNMISQGASEINVTFVINESEVERAAQLLHSEFFAEIDPNVFA